MAAGELGVTASHVGIWKHALEKGHEHIIIFEDDVVIRDHEKFNVRVQELLDHLPTNFDVAYIDCHQVEGSRQQLPNNAHASAVSKDFMAWGTHAAIYSKKGMKKLASHKWREPTDIEMWRMSSRNYPHGLASYTSEVKIADTKDEHTPWIASTIDPTGRFQEPNFSQASIAHKSNSSLDAFPSALSNSTIDSRHNVTFPAIQPSSITTEKFDRLLAPHSHEPQNLGISSQGTHHGELLGSLQQSSSSNTSYAIQTIMAIALVLKMCGLQKFAPLNFGLSPDAAIQPTTSSNFNLSGFEELLHQSPKAQYIANLVKEETNLKKDKGWTQQELVEFVNSPKFKEAYERAVKLEESARKATEADFGISPQKESTRTSRSLPPKKQKPKLEKSLKHSHR